jgi:hypothetical protein
MFIGVSSSTAVPTDVNPATLINSIGVGCNSADTTLRIYYGAGTAQIPIDLGASFPCNTVNTDLYRLTITCPVTGGAVYEVVRLNTGASVSGTLASGVIPASTTLLSYQRAWRSTGVTASAVGIDIFSDYIETGL